MNTEELVKQAKDLEERFLDADVETGDPDVDEPEASEEEAQEYDEVEAMSTMAANAVQSCMIAIEQLMRRGHEDKLKEMFGEDAKAVLKKAQECLGMVEDLLAGEPIEDDEEESEDDEESEDKEPKEKKEKEPKDEEPKDDKEPEEK
jgi:hypothetical protein